MKICSKQSGLVIKSNFPKFKYKFLEADEPLEVSDKHADKILLNSTFYEYKKNSENLSKQEVKK